MENQFFSFKRNWDKNQKLLPDTKFEPERNGNKSFLTYCCTIITNSHISSYLWSLTFKESTQRMNDTRRELLFSPVHCVTKVNFCVALIKTCSSLIAMHLFSPPKMDGSAPLGRHSIAAIAQWMAKIKRKQFHIHLLENGIWVFGKWHLQKKRQQHNYKAHFRYSDHSAWDN